MFGCCPWRMVKECCFEIMYGITSWLLLWLRGDCELTDWPSETLKHNKASCIVCPHWVLAIIHDWWWAIRFRGLLRCHSTFLLCTIGLSRCCCECNIMKRYFQLIYLQTCFHHAKIWLWHRLKFYCHLISVRGCEGLYILTGAETTNILFLHQKHILCLVILQTSVYYWKGDNANGKPD